MASYKPYKPDTRETANEIMRAMKQRAALTGDPTLAPGTAEEITRGALAVDAETYSGNLRFAREAELNERRMKMAEDQAAAQERAAAVSGGLQLGSIPIQYDLSNKAIAAQTANAAATREMTAAYLGDTAAPTVMPAAAVTGSFPADLATGMSIGAPDIAAGAAAETATSAAGAAAGTATSGAATGALPAAESGAAGLNLIGYLGPIGIGMTIGGLFEDTPAGKAGGAIAGAAIGYATAKAIFAINPVAGMIIGGLTALFK